MTTTLARAQQPTNGLNAVANDGVTPDVMAAAGVPLPLARWYHLVARRLRRYSDWDIERIMQVRLQVATSATAT